MFRCTRIIFRESYPSIFTEDGADTSKHVGVLTICKILLIYIYIYIYIYICVCVCVCCAYVGLDNKLHTMHGT